MLFALHGVNKLEGDAYDCRVNLSESILFARGGGADANQGNSQK